MKVVRNVKLAKRKGIKGWKQKVPAVQSQYLDIAPLRSKSGRRDAPNLLLLRDDEPHRLHGNI